MRNVPQRPTPRQAPKTLALAAVDPEVQKSIDECMAELNELHKSGEMRGIILYALCQDDEVVTRSSANLSSREVIGALTQLSIDMHLAMIGIA